MNECVSVKVCLCYYAVKCQEIIGGHPWSYECQDVCVFVWVGRLVGEIYICMTYLSNFLKIPSMLVCECKCIRLNKYIAFLHVHFLRQLYV